MFRDWLVTVGVTAVVTAFSLATPDDASGKPRRWKGKARRVYFGPYYAPRDSWGYYGADGYYGSYRFPAFFGGVFSGGYYLPTSYYGYVTSSPAPLVIYGAPRNRSRRAPVEPAADEGDFRVPPPTPADSGRQTRPRRGRDQQRNEAVVVVRVPSADAEVTMNGEAMDQTGKSREFIFADLNGDRTLKVKFTARWAAENGPEVTRTRSVKVRPGRKITIDFNRPPRAERLGPPRAERLGPPREGKPIR
jgi:uncharacterized protein (TIGR03000 family)